MPFVQQFLYQHFLTYTPYTIISKCIRKKSVGNVVVNTGVHLLTNNTVFIDIWMNLKVQPIGNIYWETLPMYTAVPQVPIKCIKR